MDSALGITSSNIQSSDIGSPSSSLVYEVWTIPVITANATVILIRGLGVVAYKDMLSSLSSPSEGSYSSVIRTQHLPQAKELVG